MCMLIAVQNERDRISVRRTSYDDAVQNSQLSVSILLNAEMMSRQVSQVSNSTDSGRTAADQLLLLPYSHHHWLLCIPRCHCIEGDCRVRNIWVGSDIKHPGFSLARRAWRSAKSFWDSTKPKSDQICLSLIHYHYKHVVSTKGFSFKSVWSQDFNQNHQTFKKA